MKKILWKILILWVSFSLVPIQGEAANQEATNSSSIEIAALPKLPDKYGIAKPSGGQLCKADSPKWASSAGIPHLNERLKGGIACIPADFDGNGYLDFAFLDRGWHEDQSAVGSTEVFVLFFGNEGWIKSEKLPKKVSIFPFGLYGPTKAKGEFGEPESKRPGLVESGEGGSTYIFIYSPSLKKIKMTEHASERY